MLIYGLNANPLNSSEWAFPLTECFHITFLWVLVPFGGIRISFV